MSAVVHFSYFVCQSSVFENCTFITHSSKLHSFLWMWTLRPHFWAKMFDVGDLSVLTFGNCVLRPEWVSGLWMYLRFTFFSMRFSVWLFTVFERYTRFLENWWSQSHVWMRLNSYRAWHGNYCSRPLAVRRPRDDVRNSYVPSEAWPI